jgi:hypothetical protein
MNPTDDIIRQRQKGQGGARNEFSVDRARAIEKMRRFALENPHYYLLQLIQAAVANKANFIDIDLFRLRTDLDDLKMRWTGRGFSRLELLRLFDFLFMPDDDPGCADTILLARGINAMLHFKPKRIEISCGDGTRRGSRAVVIRAGQPPQEAGVDEAINGVHVHAKELYRSLLAPGEEQLLGDREVELISDKCIAPNVQVILNGRCVSDWDSAYEQQIEWDSAFAKVNEEDLYGRLWQAPSGRSAHIDVMTWGVKIETFRPSKGPFSGLSGAVNFNRLNKTADHARIVRDEVLDELWARLRPYADWLRHKKGPIAYDITDLSGTSYAPAQLHAVLRGAGRVVVVAPTVLDNDTHLQRAELLEEHLEAPIVVASDQERHTLRALAGSSCELVEPSLRSKRDIEAFVQPCASPPPRPWLVEPLSVEPIAVGEFVEVLCEEQKLPAPQRKRVERAMGQHGHVGVHIYTPDEQLAAREDGWIEVLVCERSVWKGHVETAFRGHRVQVELPPVSPSALQQEVSTREDGASPRPVELVRLVAEAAVLLARERLREASERALRAVERTSVAAGSVGARMALYALERTTILRVLTPDDTGAPAITFVAPEDGAAALLDMPAFENLAADMVSVRDLELVLRENSGRIHGVLDERVRESGAEDMADVLSLDAEQERILRSIVGEGAYRRIDDVEELEVDGAGFEHDLSHVGACRAGLGADADFVGACTIEERRVRGRLGLLAEPMGEPSVVAVERGTRRLHFLAAAPEELGVAGWLLVEAELFENVEALEALVRERGMELLGDLVATVARVADEDRRRRVIDALLAFGGRELRSSIDGEVSVLADVTHPLARRILDLPVFPIESGLLVSAMALVRRNGAPVGSHGHRDALLADDAPAYLRRWIDAHLRREHADQVELELPADEAPPQGAELVDVVAYWIRRLRPDRGEDAGFALEVRWLDERRLLPTDAGPICLYVDGASPAVRLGPSPTLWLNAAHPLVAAAAEAPDAEPLAWLLLAVYAAINAGDEHVTNDDELAFQRRVAALLSEHMLDEPKGQAAEATSVEFTLHETS